MKLLKLQFGGLLSNNDEEGTFTCILEEKNDDKRKLFLQLTKTEAEEILLYLKQNKTEEEAMPSEILKFVQSGYNIKNARIATNEDRHVGIVNIKSLPSFSRSPSRNFLSFSGVISSPASLIAFKMTPPKYTFGMPRSVRYSIAVDLPLPHIPTIATIFTSLKKSSATRARSRESIAASIS